MYVLLSPIGYQWESLRLRYYPFIVILSRAVGVLAELLNKLTDAETFYNRSKNYKNVWNKERELMCPQSKSGEFHCPLDPTLNTWIVKDDGYTEGEYDGSLENLVTV